MKKVILLNLVIFSLISCDKIFKERNVNVKEETQTREYLVGGDKDENGCIASAGYTWSVLKNDCIRVFEIGYRLNPTEPNVDEAVISAFVIFNDNKDKAELFLPNEKESVILEKLKDDVFTYKNFSLNTKEFSLSINNKKEYEAAKEELKNIDVDEDAVDSL